MSADTPDVDAGTGTRRLLLLLTLGLYLTLVAAALITRNGWLSALCAMLLGSALLAPRLLARQLWAWLAWMLLGATLWLLAHGGHGRLALDFLPVAINLALAVLFGHTLFAGRRPLIERAIVAIEGEEHLRLPRVAAYARKLTYAWTLLFLVQALSLALLIGSGASQHSNVAALWLHLGGYILPAVFMVAEYAFRRRYLSHVAQPPLWRFLQQLARNWHRLLHDASKPADPAETAPPERVKHVG